MTLPERVRLVEVSPRDGLQNETPLLPVATKIAYIDLLSRTGLPVIEITSCVPVKWVPQLADHAEVITGISRRRGTVYPVLVPNLAGFERARGAGVDAVSVIASASEAFSRKNSNCSIGEGLDRCRDILDRAHAAGMTVRGYVSCTMGCPYEGDIALTQVVSVCERLQEMGCPEIVLSDTIGIGTPGRMREMIGRVSRVVPIDRLAVHLHDTYGQALANILTALEMGISTIDASTAGLGGCPYASGATGNVATEDLLYMLNGLGIATGVDLERLLDAGAFICQALGRQSRSRVAQALRGATQETSR